MQDPRVVPPRARARANEAGENPREIDVVSHLV